MLSDLIHYIMKYPAVTEKQLMRAFHLQASALEPMINVLVRSGMLVREFKESCGGCSKSCKPKLSLIRHV